MNTEHTASLKLKLKSTSGYSEDATYKGVTTEQWGRVVAILNGNDRTDALISEVRTLREHGKAIIKQETERTEECIRLRDQNIALIKALKELRRMETIRGLMESEADIQAVCAYQDEFDEALPGAIAAADAVLAAAGAA